MTRLRHTCIATVQDDAQQPSQPHELLPLLLVPLRLKGDYCSMAVLNSSAACLALTQALPPGAEEVVAEDSHVIRILNAHIGLPVGSCTLTVYLSEASWLINHARWKSGWPSVLERQVACRY